MNDLEPWKIWAVTGILAAMIMGGAVLRVRPIVVGEAIAQASTLTPDERSPSALTDQTQSSDDYVTYAPFSPHVTFNRMEYAAAQAPTTRPAVIMLNVTAALSGATDDYEQEPKLDVTEQLPESEIPQTEEIASRITDQFPAGVVSWFPVADDSPEVTEQNVSLISGRVVPTSTDDTVELGWPHYSGVSNTASAEDELVDLTDESGAAIVDYGSGTLLALDGADANGNPTMLRVIDGPTGQDMARIEQAGVSGYGDDTTEVWDDLRSHAIRAAVARDFEEMDAD